MLLDSFDVDKGPSLYFLHLMLPHQPWERWPDGGRYDGFDSYVLTLAEGTEACRSRGTSGSRP